MIREKHRRKFGMLIAKSSGATNVLVPSSGVVFGKSVAHLSSRELRRLVLRKMRGEAKTGGASCA